MKSLRPPDLGAAGLALLALLLVFLLILVVNGNVTKDQITTLADLGGIMGAIFTAGGLVVAFVSVLTLLNIDKVSQNAVKPIFDEIPKQIEARLQTFQDAFQLLLRAQDRAAAWKFRSERLRAIEDEVERALAIESSIRGGEKIVANSYYQAAALMYDRLLRPEYYHSDFELPETAEFPAILMKAHHWLIKAVDAEEGDDSESYAKLAEVVGMAAGDFAESLRYIARANEFQVLLPSGDYSLVMLLGSCKTETQLVELARALKLRAPLDRVGFRGLLIEEERARAAYAAGNVQSVRVIAVTRFDRVDARLPRRVSVIRVDYGPPGTAAAWWHPRGAVDPSAWEGIPAHASGANDEQTEFLPLDDLAGKVLEEFYVIGLFQPRGFPERR